MTAKKEAYSGPPLVSDMSAGREGASSADRGGGEDEPGAWRREDRKQSGAAKAKSPAAVAL